MNPRRAGLLLIILFFSCGDDSTSPPPQEIGPVLKDHARARTAVIGPAGGSISVVAGGGIEYTLEIAEGALIDATEITVTPILAIDGLGLSNGLAGAVDLEPSGLKFARAPLLHITGIAPAPVDSQLTGFNSNKDFSRRVITLAGAGVTGASIPEIIVVVSQFEIAGAGFGNARDISQFAVQSSNTIDAMFSTMLSISPAPWGDAERASARVLANAGFAQAVLPKFGSASTDGKLVDAVATYERWRQMLAVVEVNGAYLTDLLSVNLSDLSVPPEYQDEVDQALGAAASAVRNAVDRNQSRCGGEHGLVALKNVLCWERQAHILGIDTLSNGLDRDTIRQNLCARILIDEFELPGRLDWESQQSLDVRVGMAFGGSGDMQVASFQVMVTGNGCDIQNPTGFTDRQGHYRIVYRRSGGPIASITVTACFLYPGTTEQTSLCESRASTPPAYYLAGDYIGTGPLDIDPGLTILHVTQSQRVVSGTFRTLSGVESLFGHFTAFLSGTSLIDVDVEFDNCEIVGTQPTASIAVAENKTTILLGINANDCHGHSLSSISACGPHSQLETLDLSGVWTGNVTVGDQRMSISANVTGNFGHVGGIFTGERSGAFETDIFRFDNFGRCVLGTLENFEIAFSDCPLTPGTPFENGCVEYNSGVMSIILSSEAGWIDSCTGGELVKFSLSHTMDLCTGN